MIYSYPIVQLTTGIAAAYGASNLSGYLISKIRFPVLSQRGRTGYIDGLRGYLAISVLLHHFVICMQIYGLGGRSEPPSMHILNNLGAGAVALFFMATGLVFYPKILDGFKATEWPIVYIGRFFRIIPLIVFAAVIVGSLIVFRTGHTLDESLIHEIYTSPLLGVLWTLRYEGLFYLFVMPACALGMDTVRNRGFASWTLPAALLCGSLVFGKFFGGTATFLPLFAIGMIAHEIQARDSLRRLLSTKIAASLASAGLIAAVSLPPTPYDAFWLPFYGFFLICVACGNSLFGALATKSATILGDLSYSCYLIHVSVLSVFFIELGLSDISAVWLPAFMPILSSAVIFISAGTYLVIERPAIRLGKRIITLFNSRLTTLSVIR